MRRIATELRPRMLDDLGLVAAIHWQVHEFERRTGIRCAFTTTVEERRLPPEVATAMFRILQEALTNVARHARAKHVTVRLEESHGVLKMEIRDDGVGIRATTTSDPAALGLLGMNERARLLGGEVQVQALQGKGTSVNSIIPARIKERDKWPA